MFRLMGKEINAILGAQTILIWTYASAKSLSIFFSPPTFQIVDINTANPFRCTHYCIMEYQ